MTEKLIVHANVPEYDQLTQYVVEGEPEEREDCTFIPNIVLDLPPQVDNPEMPT